jgi:hypothetical protein
VLPIAAYQTISVPATGLVNLAFQYRLYATDYAERIGVVDSNNYMICGFGQKSPSSTTFSLEIPYSTLSSTWGYTVGQYTNLGSGVTQGVWYYPIIKMDFTNRNCKLSLDNGNTWSGTMQMYSNAGAAGSTLNKVVVTHPETSSSPSYGNYISYIDDMQLWTGVVYGAPPDVGDLNISTFSATDSGYLMYDLSGHVGYTSSNLTTCEAKVYQQNEGNTSPLFNNAGLGYEGTVILWNTNLVNYTQLFPNNVYIGHGYSTASDTWFVEGFKVHYYIGQNTNLKFDYTCYEQYGTGNDTQVFHSQGLSSSYPDYNNTLISTPSGLLNQIPIGGQVCTDWLCNLKLWFSNTLLWLFQVNPQTLNQVETFKLVMGSKAPFAYVNSVFAINLSMTNASMTVPAISIPILVQYKGVNILNTHLTLSDGNNNLSSILGYIRPVFLIMLWIGFVFFLINVGREVMKT